jgi:hypothetical protein
MIVCTLLCVLIGLGSGQTGARADVIKSVEEESGFGFTQTDFQPGANITGNDPVTFNKFNPGSAGIPADAKLLQVDVSFDWGFRNQITASLPASSNPIASVTVDAFGTIAVGKPDVTITGPNDLSSKFLFATQSFQNDQTFSGPGPQDFATKPASFYFHDLPPNYTPPPEDLPLKLLGQANPIAMTTSYTPASPADFLKFLGPGTVSFDVVATAGVTIPNNSGNAGATSMTYAFPQMTVTYTYSTSAVPGQLPEPPTLLVLGVGIGGLWLARRFRSRKRTP